MPILKEGDIKNNEQLARLTEAHSDPVAARFQRLAASLTTFMPNPIRGHALKILSIPKPQVAGEDPKLQS